MVFFYFRQWVHFKADVEQQTLDTAIKYVLFVCIPQKNWTEMDLRNKILALINLHLEQITYEQYWKKGNKIKFVLVRN